VYIVPDEGYSRDASGTLH